MLFCEDPYEAPCDLFCFFPQATALWVLKTPSARQGGATGRDPRPAGGRCHPGSWPVAGRFPKFGPWVLPPGKTVYGPHRGRPILVGITFLKRNHGVARSVLCVLFCAFCFARSVSRFFVLRVVFCVFCFVCVLSSI